MRASLAMGGVLATIAVTSAIAVALAVPHYAPADSVVRGLADCAAVATLGLAIVPWFDSAGRRRDELRGRASGPLFVACATWLVAELIRQALAAADTAGVALMRLPLRTAVYFTLHTVAGRAGLVSIAAAALVCVVTGSARGSSTWSAALMVSAGGAGTGIAARALSGHLSEDVAWGGVGDLAVAVHALAAAVWCGGLAALAITVNHRGQWARVLPRFSQLSLWCVAGLLVSGTIGALLAAGTPIQWYATGYGRLLLAKTLLLTALIVLGWRNRTVWLPAARAHRASAQLSRSRSVGELAVMVAALTLAAALAVTG